MIVPKMLFPPKDNDFNSSEEEASLNEKQKVFKEKAKKVHMVFFGGKHLWDNGNHNNFIKCNNSSHNINYII